MQQVVEEALERLLGFAVRLTGASRTDAGVHARGQVAHLELVTGFSPRGLVHGANHALPEDVRILAAAGMPDGFHARKHAWGKEYVYRLSRSAIVSPLDSLFVARVPETVNVENMKRATAFLPGRHDFSAFALAGGGHGQPCRTIAAAGWEEEGEELRFRVVGEGFLSARHGSCSGGNPGRGRYRPAVPRELRRPARRWRPRRGGTHGFRARIGSGAGLLPSGMAR